MKHMKRIGWAVAIIAAAGLIGKTMAGVSVSSGVSVTYTADTANSNIVIGIVNDAIAASNLATTAAIGAKQDTNTTLTALQATGVLRAELVSTNATSVALIGAKQGTNSTLDNLQSTGVLRAELVSTNNALVSLIGGKLTTNAAVIGFRVDATGTNLLWLVGAVTNSVPVTVVP